MKPRIEKLQCPAPGNNCLPTRTIRTFLAEDSPLLIALLARSFSMDTRIFIVGSATNGRKAVCNAPTLQPDLVITDLHKPGLNGAEVTRRLKQLPNPPVILVTTGDDTPEARRRSTGAGADAFFGESRQFRAAATFRNSGVIFSTILNKTMPNQNISVKQSLHSNEDAPAGDGNSTLLRRDGKTRQACAHCRADIVDGHWFCRLPGDREHALLCSPSCALRYFDRSHVGRNGSDQDWGLHEHRFHFFANGEKP
jgi:DNA-binding NarL/FixJ family response regulator